MYFLHQQTSALLRLLLLPGSYGNVFFPPLGHLEALHERKGKRSHSTHGMPDERKLL